MDMVIRNAVTEDMRTPDPAAIVLHFVVALWCCLGGVGARTRRQSGNQEIHRDGEVRKRLSASPHRIRNCILKFQILEADTVSPLTSRPVTTSHVFARYVLVREEREAGGSERRNQVIRKVVVAIEKVQALRRLEIDATQEFTF